MPLPFTVCWIGWIGWMRWMGGLVAVVVLRRKSGWSAQSLLSIFGLESSFRFGRQARAAVPVATPAPAKRVLNGSRKNGSRSTPCLSIRDPISLKTRSALTEQPNRMRLSFPRDFCLADWTHI
jgi:hypothetical protein